MLSNEEKLRIQLEETYRSEVRSGLIPKKRFDIETITKVLQGLAIVIGIWATYNEFKKQNEAGKQQERDRYEQTAKEFRKYFYEKQFDSYAEATEAAATLATEDITSDEYKRARKTFYRLFWGKLSIVEEKTVETSMVNFRNLLEEYEKAGTGVTQSDLQQASLKLAHDASRYTINVWIDSTERANYNR